MKKLSDKNSISKTAKLLFFIKYIFSNLFTFSFLPRKKIRIFSINYLSTVINYTYNRKLYFDVNYTSEKWHKINENNNFDFDEWKYNIFDKRRHLAIKFLVNEINSNNKMIMTTNVNDLKDYYKDELESLVSRGIVDLKMIFGDESTRAGNSILARRVNGSNFPGKDAYVKFLYTEEKKGTPSIIKRRIYLAKQEIMLSNKLQILQK